MRYMVLLPVAKSSCDYTYSIGRWNGFRGRENWPFDEMLSFLIRPSTNQGEYEAYGTCADGTMFKIFGGYERKDDGSVSYSFTLKPVQWDGSDSAWDEGFFAGTVKDDGMTLSGLWGYSEGDRRYKFLFKRGIDPNVLVARPRPEDFERDRIRALWDYARTAARNEARRKLFPWSFMTERIAMRREYLALLSREDSSSDRLAVLRRKLTHVEAQNFIITGRSKEKVFG